MKKLTKLLGILSSSLILLSCEAPPKLPKGELKALNTTSSRGAYALTFNLETDFNENLKLKEGITGTRVDVGLEGLHKHWCVDAAAKEELTRYALQWKVRYEKLEKQLRECRQ